ARTAAVHADGRQGGAALRDHPQVPGRDRRLRRPGPDPDREQSVRGPERLLRRQAPQRAARLLPLEPPAAVEDGAARTLGRAVVLLRHERNPGITGTAAEGGLTLSAAGTAGRRQARREEAERLGAATDWPRLAESLRARRLLTVLGPRIIELAGGWAGEGFLAAVEQSIEAGRRQAALLQLVALR